MPNYTITITGSIPAGNEAGHSGEVDRLGRSLVDQLAAAGHRVETADFQDIDGVRRSLLTGQPSPVPGQPVPPAQPTPPGTPAARQR